MAAVPNSGSKNTEKNIVKYEPREREREREERDHYLLLRLLLHVQIDFIKKDGPFIILFHTAAKQPEGKKVKEREREIDNSEIE